MFKRLHPLFEEDGTIGAESGVESTPAAEVNTQVEESQTGVDSQAAAEPEKQNNYEKAFAKRLEAAKASWEKENSEKYKDYDTLKDTAEFFREKHGFNDLLSMKEEIELAKLQEKAEANNISPEMQKRLEALEAKAAKGDELEQKQQENERIAAYFTTLDKFLEGKGVESKALNDFMIENEMQYNPNNIEKSLSIALKAFQADEALNKLATAKEDAVKEYLASKKAPKVEGAPGAASVQSVDTRKMTWDQLEKHTLERIKAASTPQ